jgi:hydroxymethylpyrimidine/phosphomethylpyrimidine kinase
MKTIGDKIGAFSVTRHSPHAAQRAPALLARALTIAGSDSGGGAGIQADLKTFSAFRVYCMSVLTAVTAQNTVGVRGVETLSPAFNTAQFESVFGHIGVDTLKTGMLGTAAVVVAVAAMIAKAGLTNLVVDPVMVAKSGDHLLAENAVHVLRTRLLPLALVITPNWLEAEALVGVPIRTLDEMREAARRLHALGPHWVFIKGGHGGGDTVTDLLYDGQTFDRLDGRAYRHTAHARHRLHLLRRDDRLPRARKDCARSLRCGEAIYPRRYRRRPRTWPRPPQSPRLTLG